jgi:hypothetical protein
MEPWYSNPSDHRCPHDSWLESLVIEEQASGARREIRIINLHLTLLGAYHDGKILFNYQGVRRYNLRKIVASVRGDFRSYPCHGDWIADRFRIVKDGYIVHHIIFQNHAEMTVESKDISYEWAMLQA